MGNLIDAQSPDRQMGGSGYINHQTTSDSLYCTFNVRASGRTPLDNQNDLGYVGPPTGDVNCMCGGGLYLPNFLLNSIQLGSTLPKDDPAFHESTYKGLTYYKNKFLGGRDTCRSVLWNDCGVKAELEARRVPNLYQPIEASNDDHSGQHAGDHGNLKHVYETCLPQNWKAVDDGIPEYKNFTGIHELYTTLNFGCSIGEGDNYGSFNMRYYNSIFWS